MKEQFNPKSRNWTIRVTEREKAALFKRVLIKEKEGYEILHPMKKLADSNGDTLYYISMRRPPIT